jgi:ribosomal protein S18 acetylase RimI-like enzyme
MPTSSRAWSPDMNPRNLFLQYAAQRVLATPPGYRLDPVEGITRYTPLAPGLEGLVMFSRLSAEEADDAIDAQIRHFRGVDFEWKVYGMDRPADLGGRLERKGFQSDVSEAFMLYPIPDGSGRPSATGITIRRVTTPEGVRDVVKIQDVVWGRSFSWLEKSLVDSLDRSAIFCAYLDDRPVGSGWMELPPRGGDFAELHGGAVVPELRGRGIYSALYDARVAEAQRRGVRYFAVDAAPMSRPILERKGFRYICETIPYRRKADRPG